MKWNKEIDEFDELNIELNFEPLAYQNLREFESLFFEIYENLLREVKELL